MRQRKTKRFTELELLENRRMLTTASIGAGSILNIAGTGSGDSIFVNKKSNGKVTVSGVAGEFTLGSGSGKFNKINITGAGGSDNISISSNVNYISATIAGGTGNDTLTGGVGNDLVSGNDGNDRLDGGAAGADTLTGGANLDTANYSARTDALTITLDGAANDGANGGAEKDNVQTEEVLTGSGNDSIVGSGADDYISSGAGADTVRGGGGNDVITGSTGSDSLLGQDGDDFIQAQNQDMDVVNGGSNSDNSPDLDLASIDEIDVPNSSPGPDASNLDPDFGTDGKVVGPDFGWDYINASTIDSQGRIIFVGADYNEGSGYDFVAVRYNADGSFDEGFGDEGVASVGFGGEDGEGSSDDDIAYGVTVDADDNIIIVGNSVAYSQERSDNDFAAARLLAEDGSLDLEFANEGTFRIDSFDNYANDSAADVVVQADGKIVIVGSYAEYFGDSSFSGEGSDFEVLRLTPGGQLDEDFNNAQPVLVDVGLFDNASSVVLQTFASDGGSQRIVVGGTADGDFAIARLLEDGSVDSSFGSDGTDIRDFGADETLNDLALGANNQIYAVGSTSEFAPDVMNGVAGVLAAYDSGANFLDLRIETRGSYLSYNAVIVDDEGKILVAGANETDFVLGKYNSSDLKLDTSFAPDLVTTDFSDVESEFDNYDNAFSIFLRPDGQIVQAGINDYNNDGGIQPAIAQFNGVNSQPPGSGEITVEDIEKVVDDEDVFGNPPDSDVKKFLDRLSTSGKFNLISQPREDGSAIIPLTGGDDLITFSTVVDGSGFENLAVNVNGIVLYYRQVGGLSISPEGDIATRLVFIDPAGNDKLLGNSNVLIPMYIDMGSGNDSIIGGELNDTIFGGTGNDTIEAQNGNDIVVGGDGNDKLNGSGNRDIIIGGKGKDTISGGSSDDIVMGGNTSYDTDLAALEALQSEWISGDDYATRINNLKNGGGANGSTRLIFSGGSKNVFNDNAIDQLKGADGLDWFIRSTGSFSDVLVDKTGAEQTSTA